MYNLENAPVELIRCLELGLPMPSGLLQRFPLVVLDQWRQKWTEGPGLLITAERTAVELERQQAENKRREQQRQEQMAYWIEPGTIVTINAPRTKLDKRQGWLDELIWSEDYTLHGKVRVGMTRQSIAMKNMVAKNE